MLDIPSSLIEKLQQKIQTIGTNSNPRMDVIAQRAAKYLNQGSFLYPRTVRTGNSLGPLDVCIRRENFNEEPTEIVMVYIENGIAKVATLPYVHSPDQLFKWQYDIGPADEVACDFDGRFEPIFDRTGIYFDTETIWALQTFGEPYIALINAGVLTLYQNNVAITPVLVPENAVKCSLIRGFKSRYMLIDNDQGMVCVYTKTDGKVYYRNYCQQINETYMWELEREITEFVGTVDNISTFLCADYRLGLLAEIAGEIQLLVTERDWSGMAILPENITLNVFSTAERIAIRYSNYKEDEYINLDVTSIALRLHGVTTYIISAENIAYTDLINEIEDDYGYKVRIIFDEPTFLNGTAYTDFSLIDEDNTVFGASSVTQIDNKTIDILFQNFNNAVGDLTVGYTPGLMTGEAGQTIDADSFVFTPTGLVPFAVSPPVPVSAENIEGWMA